MKDVSKSLLSLERRQNGIYIVWQWIHMSIYTSVEERKKERILTIFKMNSHFNAEVQKEKW